MGGSPEEPRVTTFRKKTELALAISLAATALMPAAAHAQNATTAPTAAASADTSLPTVTLDLRDAPVRDALQQLFAKEKLDYSLADSVTGYATLKITDQPFETALRLILRSSSVPLSYHKEGTVYVISRRVLNTQSAATLTPPPSEQNLYVASSESHWDTIPLTYLDPADVQQLLRITILSTFTRQGGRTTAAGAASAPPNTAQPNTPGPGIAPSAPTRIAY